MFESLSRIQHPVARSVTAAFTTLSIITLASAIVVGVTKPKDESVYKTAVYGFSTRYPYQR
jgi:uncharacterized protein